jgi:hypothetical protein
VFRYNFNGGCLQEKGFCQSTWLYNQPEIPFHFDAVGYIQYQTQHSGAVIGVIDQVTINAPE